jgi:hypothetical protein
MHDAATAALPEAEGPRVPPAGAEGATEPGPSGPPQPPRRSRLGPVRRHPIRAAVVILLVVGLTIVGWSYGRALTVSSSDSLSTRSVEWVRDHGGSPLVNWIEREWYNHHQPPKGGVPKAGLIPSVAPTTPPALAHRPAHVPPHLPIPEPVVPLATPPLPGEGIWHPVGSLVGGLPAVYATAVRPDPVHTSLVTGVSWMDTKLLKADLYAGTAMPGGSWQHMAPIPPDLRSSLIADFNSGFRLQDSRGGYYAEGRMAKPLLAGAASLVIRTDGTATVAKWGRDATLGPNVSAVRQNLALIVDNGDPVPGLDSDANVTWGQTSGNRTLVWRSGVGVTPSGALVYAGGVLSAYSLGEVLAHAGAVRAMELDINGPFVDFFSYVAPAGQEATPTDGTKLTPDMTSSPARYLVIPSSRDFVAMFAR